MKIWDFTLLLIIYVTVKVGFVKVNSRWLEEKIQLTTISHVKFDMSEVSSVTCDMFDLYCVTSVVPQLWHLGETLWHLGEKCAPDDDRLLHTTVWWREVCWGRKVFIWILKNSFNIHLNTPDIRIFFCWDNSTCKDKLKCFLYCLLGILRRPRDARDDLQAVLLLPN